MFYFIASWISNAVFLFLFTVVTYEACITETHSIWNKEELSEEWKELIIVPIHKKDDKTDFNNYRGISLWQLCTKYYPTSFSQG